MLALNVLDLSKDRGTLPAPQLGIVEFNRYISSFVPDSCPVASICKTFPNCSDYGSCQGFDDARLMSLPRHSSGDKVDTFCDGHTVMFGALLSRVPDPFTLMGVFHFLYIAMIALSVVCGILGLMAGLALLGGKQAGRTLALLAGVLSVSNIPLRTAPGRVIR